MRKERFLALVSALFFILFVSTSCEKSVTEETTESYETEVSTQVIGEYFAEFGGIAVESVTNYTGTVSENGTDADFDGVLAVVIVNTTDKTLRYACITAELPQGEIYTFNVSSVPPGVKCVSAENGGAVYKNDLDSALWKSDGIVFFEEEPSLHLDELSCSGSDGILTVKNISEKDIEGDIAVYYKSKTEDGLLLGITYRVTVKGGIKSGEYAQVAAGHYVSGISVITFSEYIAPEVQT